MRAALRKVRQTRNIIFVPHTVTARETEDTLLFTVRDPLARFVSGFNSAKRRDNGSPWDPGEVLAFPRYPTANVLAEAISSETTAHDAMRQIHHINRHQHSWFPSPAVEWLSLSRYRVLWVGFTETLAADFETLKRRLKLPSEVALPLVHRAPDNSDTFLSDKARENLAHWYHEDIQLVEWLKKNLHFPE
jgi:hypothetical protein